MKRLEVLIHSLRNWYWKRKGFTWQHDKRFWAKSRSECCNATVHGKTLFKGKPLTKPFSQYNDKQRPLIQYRDFCDDCKQQCKVLTVVKT